MIGRRPHRLDEMCWCGVQSASPMDHGGSYSTPPQVVRFDLEASGHDGRAAVRALHRKALELVGPDVEYQFDAVEMHPEEIAFNGDVLSVRAAGRGVDHHAMRHGAAKGGVPDGAPTPKGRRALS